MTDAVVAPAAMVADAALRLYAVGLAGVNVTVTGICCAALMVAVRVVEMTGLAPQAFVLLPLVVSQMLVGDTDRVTAGRWEAAVRPYLKTGYWVVVPKSQGSSLPDTPSTFAFQLA